MDMDPSKVQEMEKTKEIDPDSSETHDNAPEPMEPEEPKEKKNPTRGENPSKVQEVEKIKEIDPDSSVTHDNAPEPMEPEESEEKTNPTCVSALDVILKSLWRISIFTKEVARFQETNQSFTEDESAVQLHDFIIKDLATNPVVSFLTFKPYVSVFSYSFFKLHIYLLVQLFYSLQEANGVSELFVTIMELLPRWRKIPLNINFEIYEIEKKTCNRCRMDTIYPVQRSYGLLMVASSLREIKSALLDFTFEKIIKVIRINLMMPCDKEGCGKKSYVQRVINAHPPVFTIALEWENNETEEEILDTISILEAEIDISEIFQYEGDSAFTKYHLVSMVCLCGDEYNCVAYENKRWVRHFRSESEVIGDWNNVRSFLPKLNIRPEILFFENVIERDQIVLGQRSEDQ